MKFSPQLQAVSPMSLKSTPMSSGLIRSIFKSNMRRLGRIGIFSESIHKFLVNLKRHHQEIFETVEKNVVDRYLAQKDLDCFSRVKPSESRKTLNQVSKDLFNLVEQFKRSPELLEMYSYKMLQRVLTEQCNLTGDKDQPVELKKPKEISSDSLQNPSDPDASYSGHKGQGYQVSDHGNLLQG